MCFKPISILTSRYGKAYIDYKQALHIGGTNDVVHQGLTRCQNILQSQHGPRWRDKLPPMPDMSFINRPFPPSASSQQTSSPIGSSNQQTAPPPSKGPSPEEEFEKMKDKGNNFVKEVSVDFFTQGQFWLSGIVVACVCLCVCPSVCINHQLVRAITHHPFKLGSPNLDQRCKRPWLRSLLFCGMIDRDL